jgi:hypothetical protein
VGRPAGHYFNDLHGGFSVTFMKINKDCLDPSDKYESDWLGGKGGAPETTVSGDGKPAVGILGRSGVKDLSAMGIVFGADAKPGG